MTTFTNFTEEMTTKKATVKISQKNKFLRDQKEVLVPQDYTNGITEL